MNHYNKENKGLQLILFTQIKIANVRRSGQVRLLLPTNQSGQLEQVLATSDQAEEVCKAIRECIAEIYDEAIANEIRINRWEVLVLNVSELFAQANIDVASR